MKEYICSCEIMSKRSFLNRKIKAYSKEDAVTKFIEYIKKEYNIFVFSSSKLFQYSFAFFNSHIS